MYKLLCSNLSKSHRSLTNFTGYYRIVAEKYHKTVLSNRKLISDTDLQNKHGIEENPEPLECPEEILDVEPAIDTKAQHTSFLTQQITRVPLIMAAASAASSRFFHSTFVNKKFNSPPIKKTFKSKEAERYYQVAIQQCLEIKSKIAKCEQLAKWTPRVPKVLTPVTKKLEPIEQKKKKKKKKFKKLKTRKEGKSNMMPELDKIASMKTSRADYQFKSNKQKITYPIHTIRYKVGTTGYKLQHKIKQTVTKEKKVKIVYKIPVPGPYHTKKIRYYEKLKKKQKPMLPQPIIKKPQKMVLLKRYDEHSEQDKQQKKLERAVIRQHPTVRQANTTTKMAIKSRYNRLLKKSGLLYQGPSKSKHEIKEIVVKDVPKKVQLKEEEKTTSPTLPTPSKEIHEILVKVPDVRKPLPELQVSEHPIAGAKQVKIETPLKHPKRILSEKAESFDIDAMCIKTNSNSNMTTSYGDYVAESNEKVRDFVDAHNKEIKEHQDRALDDITSFESIAEYIKKLKNLRDRTAVDKASVKKPEASKRVDAVQEVESKKIKDLVKKFEDKVDQAPVPLEKNGENKNPYPVTKKVNVKKEVETFARKAVNVVKDPATGKAQPNEQMVRSQSVTNLPEGKIFVIRSVPVKTVRSETLVKKAKLKPLTPKSSMPQFTKTARDENIPKRVRSKSEAPKNKETYQFGFSKFEVPEEKNKVPSPMNMIMEQYKVQPPPEIIVPMAEIKRLNRRKRKERERKLKEEGKMQQRKLEEEQNQAVVAAKDIPKNVAETTAHSKPEEKLERDLKSEIAKETERTALKDGKKDAGETLDLQKGPGVTADKVRKEGELKESAEKVTSTLLKEKGQRSVSEEKPTSTEVKAKVETLVDLRQNVDKATKAPPKMEEVSKKNIEKVDRKIEEKGNTGRVLEKQKKFPMEPLAERAAPKMSDKSENAATAPLNEKRQVAKKGVEKAGSKITDQKEPKLRQNYFSFIKQVRSKEYFEKSLKDKRTLNDNMQLKKKVQDAAKTEGWKKTNSNAEFWKKRKNIQVPKEVPKKSTIKVLPKKQTYKFKFGSKKSTERGQKLKEKHAQKIADKRYSKTNINNIQKYVPQRTDSMIPRENEAGMSKEPSKIGVYVKQFKEKRLKNNIGLNSKIIRDIKGRYILDASLKIPAEKLEKKSETMRDNQRKFQLENNLKHAKGILERIHVIPKKEKQMSRGVVEKVGSTKSEEPENQKNESPEKQTAVIKRKYHLESMLKIPTNDTPEEEPSKVNLERASEKKVDDKKLYSENNLKDSKIKSETTGNTVTKVKDKEKNEASLEKQASDIEEVKRKYILDSNFKEFVAKIIEEMIPKEKLERALQNSKQILEKESTTSSEEKEIKNLPEKQTTKENFLIPEKKQDIQMKSSADRSISIEVSDKTSSVVVEEKLISKKDVAETWDKTSEEKKEEKLKLNTEKDPNVQAATKHTLEQDLEKVQHKKDPFPEKVQEKPPDGVEIQLMKNQVKPEGGKVENKVEFSGEKIKLEGKPIDTKSLENEKQKKFTKRKEATTKIVRLVKKIDFKKPTNKAENYDKSTGPENRPTIPREKPPKSDDKPKKKPSSKTDIVLPPKGRNDPKMKYTRSGGVSYAKSRNDTVKRVIEKHIKDVSQELISKESLANMIEKERVKKLKETKIAWNKQNNKTTVNPEKENTLDFLDTNKDMLKEHDELIRKILEKKPRINMAALALDVMKRNERIRRNRKHKREGPKLIVKLKYSSPLAKAKSRDKKIKPLHYFLGKSFDLNTTQHPEVNTEEVEKTEREVHASNITFKKIPDKFQFVENDRLPSSLHLPKTRRARIEDDILKLGTEYRNAEYTSKDVLWRSQGDLDLCFDNLKRAKIEDDCLKQTNNGKDVPKVEKNFFLRDLQSTNQTKYSDMDDTSFCFPTLVRRKIEDDFQKIESISKTDKLQKTECDSDSVENAPLPIILDQPGKIEQAIDQKAEGDMEDWEYKAEIIKQTNENPIVEQQELPEGDVNDKTSNRFKSIIKKKHFKSRSKTDMESVENATPSVISDQLDKVRQAIVQKVEAYMVGLQPKAATPSEMIKESNENHIVERRELPEEDIKYKMSNRFKPVMKKKHVRSRSKTEINSDLVEKTSLPAILDQLNKIRQAIVQKVEADLEGLQSKAGTPIEIIKQPNENRIVDQQGLPEGDVKYKMSNRFKSVIKKKHVRNTSKTELKEINLPQNAPNITGTATAAIAKPKLEQSASSEKLFRKDDTFDTETVKAPIDEGSGTKRDIEKLIDIMKTADAELEKVLKAYEVFKVPQKMIPVKPEDDTKENTNAEVREKDNRLREHDLAVVKPGESIDVLYQNSMDSKTFVVTAEEMKHFEKEYKTAMGDSRPPSAKIENLEEGPEKNVLPLKIDNNSIRKKHKTKYLIENILVENDPRPPSRDMNENANTFVGNRVHKKLSPPTIDRNNIRDGHKSGEKSTKTTEKPAKSALGGGIQRYTKKHTRAKTEEMKSNDKPNKDTKTHTKLCSYSKRQPNKERVFNKDDKKSSGTGKTAHKIIDKKNSFTSRTKRSLRLDVKRHEHKREVCGKSTESDGIEPRIIGGKSLKKNPDGKLLLQSLTNDGKETLGNKIVVACSDDVPGESTTGIDKSEERKEKQKKPLEIPGKRPTKLRTVKVRETHVSMSTDLPHDSSTLKTTNEHRAVSNKPKKLQTMKTMGKNNGFSKKPQNGKLDLTPSQWIVLKPNRKRKHYKDGNKINSNIGNTKVNAQFSIYRSDLIDMFLKPRKFKDKELPAEARKQTKEGTNINKNKSRTATKSNGQKELTTIKDSDFKSDIKQIFPVGKPTLTKSNLLNGARDSPDHSKSHIEITNLVRNTRVNILQTKQMLENLLETLKPVTLPQPDISASSGCLNITIDDKCDNVKENLKDTEKITNVEQVGDIHYSHSGILHKNQNLLALLDKKLTKEVGKMLVQERSVQDMDKEEKSCEGDNKGSEEKASEENLKSDNSTETNLDQRDTKCVPNEICQERLDPKVDKVKGIEEVSSKITEERKFNTILDQACKKVKHILSIVNDENVRLAERIVEVDKDIKRFKNTSTDNLSCALVNVQSKKDKTKLENNDENDKIAKTELVRNLYINMKKRKIEEDAIMTTKSKNNVDQKPKETKAVVNLKPEIDEKKPEKLNLKDGLQCKKNEQILSFEEKTIALNKNSEKLERKNGKFDNVSEKAVVECKEETKLADDHEVYKSTKTDLVKNQNIKMDKEKQKPNEVKPIMNLGLQIFGKKPEKLNPNDGLQSKKKEENSSLAEKTAGFKIDNEKLETKSEKFDNVSEKAVAETKDEEKLEDDHEVYKSNKTKELVKNRNIKMDTKKLGLEIDKRNSSWRERTKHNLSIMNLKPRIDEKKLEKLNFKATIAEDDKLKKKNKGAEGQKAAVNKYVTNTVCKVENKHHPMLKSVINKSDSEKAKPRATPVNVLIKNVDERPKNLNASTFWKNLSSQRNIEIIKSAGNLANDDTKPHSHIELRSFVSLDNVGGTSPKNKFLSKTEPCLKHFDSNTPNRSVTTNDKNKYKYTSQKIRQSLMRGSKKNTEINATKKGSSRVRASEDGGSSKMSRQSKKEQKNGFETAERQNTCQKRKYVELETKKRPVVATLSAPSKLDETNRNPSETVLPVEVIPEKKKAEVPCDKGDANEGEKECTLQSSGTELCNILLKNQHDDLRLCYNKFKAEENLRKVYAYCLANKAYFREKFLKLKTLYCNERIQVLLHQQKYKNGDLLKESTLSQVKKNVLPTMLEIAENADTDHQNETQEANGTINNTINETKIFVPKNTHMDITSFSFLENLMKHLTMDRMSYDEVHSERNGPVKAKIEEILKKHYSEEEKLYKFNKNLIRHFQQHYRKEPQTFQKQQIIAVGGALLNPRALEINEVQKTLHEFLTMELIKPYCERQIEFSIFKKHNQWLDVVCYSPDKESLSIEESKKEHPKRLAKKKVTVYIEKVPRNRYEEKKTEEPPKPIMRCCERLCLPLQSISQVALKPPVEEMTTLNKYDKEKFHVVPKVTANLSDKYKDLKITYMDIKRPVAKPDESFLPMIFRLKNKSDSSALEKVDSPETAKRQVLEFRYRLLRKLYKEFNELYEKDVNSNVGKFEKVCRYYKSVTEKMKKKEKKEVVASHLKSMDEVLGPCSKPSFERVSRFYKMVIENNKKDEGKTEESEGTGGAVNNEMQNSIGILIEKLSERITEVDKTRNDCIGMDQMLAKRGKKENGDGEDPEDNGKRS